MDFSFLNNPIKPRDITEERIQEFLDETSTKRICFSRTHKHALWTASDGNKMFTVPFKESVGTILEDKTGISLREAKSGNFYRQLTNEEFTKAESFIKEYGDIVFLRDLLDVSIALSLNFEEDGQTRTLIGDLEKTAKYDGNVPAVGLLAEKVDDFIDRNHAYRNADCVCAMPSSNVGEMNLPNHIVSRLKRFQGENISHLISFTSKTESLKNAEGANKMEILKHSGLEISPGADLSGKTVILLDDLYMSGATLQFAAMKLQEAGAKKILGLCLVKAFSNN